MATRHHASQSRKIGDDPYIGHLMGVAALVIEHGGTETQVCGALLHDTLEDTKVTYPRLKAAMGRRVASIVRECSDTEENMTREEKIRTFRERKTKYLEALKTKQGKPSVLVALADKVHNAENTLRDVRRIRATDPAAESAFWASFNSKDVSDQKWWYEGLVAAFDGIVTDERERELVARFRATVHAIFEPHQARA